MASSRGPGQEAEPDHIYTESLGRWDVWHVWCWHSGVSDGCMHLGLFPTFPCNSLLPPSARTWWSFSNGKTRPHCPVHLGTSLSLETEHWCWKQASWRSSSECVSLQEAVLRLLGKVCCWVCSWFLTQTRFRSDTFHTKLKKPKSVCARARTGQLGFKSQRLHVSQATPGKLISFVNGG